MLRDLGRGLKLLRRSDHDLELAAAVVEIDDLVGRAAVASRRIARRGALRFRRLVVHEGAPFRCGRRAAGRSRTRLRRTGLCRACRRGLFRDRDCFILIIEKLVVVIIRTGHFFQFIQKSHSGPPFTCRRLPCRCTDLCGVCRDGAQCRE